MADLISLEEAHERVRQAVRTVGVLDGETAPLVHARGRRLARDYRAEAPWPATDRSAMDGYAVRAGTGMAAGTQLDVVGVCLAGHPFDGAVADGQAIRIMTGAVVPATVDAVVPVENTSGYVEVGASVSIEQPVAPGANIRPIGSEVAIGDLLLATGSRIGAAEVGALAVLGIDPVPVFRRPVVGILATGDEVIDINRTPAPHQVRNSNAFALAAQVEACGGTAWMLGIAPDQAPALRQRLEDGLRQADIFLTIGGVSKGTHDLVHSLLAELGVVRVFHGVQIKPGKPVYFGTRTRDGHATCVFGLPGNPASAFTIFDLLVRPVVGGLSGGADGPGEFRARVAGSPFRRNRRLQAVPTMLRTADDGTLIAELGPAQPSGDPFGLMRGCAYALIPPDTAPAADLIVPVVFYSDHA